jgi:hypothetical protein
MATIDALTIRMLNSDVLIPLHQRAFICILKVYHVFQIEEGDPIGDGWLLITVEEFDDYQESPFYNLIPCQVPLQLLL